MSTVCELTKSLQACKCENFFNVDNERKCDAFSHRQTKQAMSSWQQRPQHDERRLLRVFWFLPIIYRRATLLMRPGRSDLRLLSAYGKNFEHGRRTMHT